MNHPTIQFSRRSVCFSVCLRMHQPPTVKSCRMAVCSTSANNSPPSDKKVKYDPVLLFITSIVAIVKSVMSYLTLIWFCNWSDLYSFPVLVRSVSHVLWLIVVSCFSTPSAASFVWILYQWTRAFPVKLYILLHYNKCYNFCHAPMLKYAM